MYDIHEGSSDTLELLTATQAANLLKVSTKTLANWRCKGIGPCFHKIGGVRYRRAELEALVASTLRRSTTDSASIDANSHRKNGVTR